MRLHPGSASIDQASHRGLSASDKSGRKLAHSPAAHPLKHRIGRMSTTCDRSVDERTSFRPEHFMIHHTLRRQSLTRRFDQVMLWVFKGPLAQLVEQLTLNQ